MTFASLVHPHMDVIPRPHLDRYGKLAVGLLVVLGLGALAGGIALLAKPDGSVMHFDVAILEGSPFADFMIPGLILGGLFGVGSLVTAVLGIQRSRIAPFLAFAIGAGQMVWIVVELAIIGEFSFLHPTMFLIGFGIAAAAIPWGRATFQAWHRGL